ncbi:hypothetical protein GCM10007862_28730 [Dyella lipolytica]|uniref:DUF4349 domain-containing protein n=1 Tax=Dyella lipolytica TaxID=1867835 RepID=A0ABW8IVM4_9GAMM|nr:DUF4349 domain-containing protein [Dyella lipolytica]GLQ47822.1 hypothetical protein GCM10007862_28730 [Dyella lipolytica]
MSTAKRWILVATLVLVVAGCSKKQEVGPLPVAGETGKAGAKLAYEHHLRIELQREQIAPRMAAVREACESARFGACNVLRLDQSEESGSLTVRIVPSGVEPISALASQSGKLAWRQTQAEDLADAVNDNQQQLKELEIYSTQIEQLAERKDLSASDLIALSHERAQIQIERENLQNTAAQQQRRIDTNLLQMDFTDEAHGRHLGITFGEWTDQLYDGIRDTLSMLAYGIPFLSLAFPLALCWRWLWRRVTRKSRERRARLENKDEST